jgi:hypothetical protein
MTRAGLSNRHDARSARPVVTVTASEIVLPEADAAVEELASYVKVAKATCGRFMKHS